MNNKQYEEHLYTSGYKNIAGCDEVGRGCIAGPVYACAVIMKPNSHIDGVTDSKKLTDKKRRTLASKIKDEAISYKIVAIDNQKIDEINILEASRLAMEKAVKGLSIKPDYILTDAMKLHTKIPTLDIIHGDELSYTIACASILAKVERDDYMIELSQKYPVYHFEQNKGYPTPYHKQILFVHGITKYHRKTYEPVAKYLESQVNKA